MSQSTIEPALEFSTFVELLQWRARTQPHEPAYSFLADGESGESHVTYAELDRRSRAIATHLQSLAAAGECALLLYPPGLEFIAAFFGCLYAGVIAIPAHPPHPARLNGTAPRLQAIVCDAQATVVLTTTAVQAIAEPMLNRASGRDTLRWLATDALSDDQAGVWQAPPADASTLAFIQYTSGSTSRPKGVMVSHGNLLHNSALIYRHFGHSADSRVVSWLPPYHDMGLIGGILQPLYAGIPVTLMPPTAFLMRPLRWLEVISRTRATTSGGPNFAYDLCARKISPEQRATLDLSSWDVAFNGSEPVRRDTIDRFAATFAECGFRREAFYPCYGLAEVTLFVSGGLKAAAPTICNVQPEALEAGYVVTSSAQDGETGQRRSEHARCLVGCGHVSPEQQVVIADPESSTRCAPDQVGEIWISGPSVTTGYLHQPDTTARTFHAYLADTGEGPFLRSGDLGFLHNGELFITGRLKDLIIVGGRNHYSEDIEQTIESSHPSLRPGCSAAFAVDIEDEERLVIVAEVERQGRLAADRQAHFKTIVQAIRQTVAERHALRVHEVMLLKPASLPKTSSGKTQRHACRVGFLSGALKVADD